MEKKKTSKGSDFIERMKAKREKAKAGGGRLSEDNKPKKAPAKMDGKARREAGLKKGQEMMKAKKAKKSETVKSETKRSATKPAAKKAGAKAPAKRRRAGASMTKRGVRKARRAARK